MVDGTPERDPLLDSHWATVSPQVRAANIEWSMTEGYEDTGNQIIAVDAVVRGQGQIGTVDHNPYRGLSLVQLAEHLDYTDEQGDHTSSGQIRAVQAEITQDVAHLGVTAEDIQAERAKARELNMPIPESDVDVALSIYKARR